MNISRTFGPQVRMYPASPAPPFDDRPRDGIVAVSLLQLELKIARRVERLG